MKNLYFISLSILILTLTSSCSKDQEPLLEVSIEMTKSSKFQSALVSVSSFSLFEVDLESNQIGTSIIQQWAGAEINQNLITEEKNNVLIESHWELELTGVKPDFEISVNENGNNNQVLVEYIESIMLTKTLQLSKNKDYEIIISIDTDNAIIIDNGQYILNWDFVSATAMEK